MTEREFHEKRLMFAVTGDRTVLVAPFNSPLSHTEWLAHALGSSAVARSIVDKEVRGYALDGRLVAYTGLECSHRVDPDAVAAALCVVSAVLNLAGDGPIKEVGFGLKAGKDGEQPWEPRVVKTVVEFDAMIKLAESSKKKA